MMYGVDEDSGFCGCLFSPWKAGAPNIFRHHTMGKLDPSDPPTSSNKSDEYETKDTNGEK
jgi:hypothetical protein